jgi:hypothetical protein
MPEEEKNKNMQGVFVPEVRDFSHLDDQEKEKQAALKHAVDGEKGEPGKTGKQGEPGEKGDKGAHGVQGEQGEKGVHGLKGEDAPVPHKK